MQQNHLVPSRRTIVRAAAWTAPAVAMAVAAPAYAVSPGPGTVTPKLEILGNAAITSNNNAKTYTWNLTFQSSQDIPVGMLSITITGVTSMTGFVVTSGGETWNGDPTDASRRVNPALVKANTQLQVQVVMTRSTNSTGMATATFIAQPSEAQIGAAQTY